MSKRVSFFTAADTHTIEAAEITARFQRELGLAIERLAQIAHKDTPENAVTPTTPMTPRV